MAVSTEQIYEQKLALIQSNGETAAKAVKLPYSDEEANTRWCQYHEAEQYSAMSTTPLNDRFGGAVLYQCC